jgi:hypothetical protein
VHEFEVRRVLEGTDLDSPEGRDRALERAGGLIARAQGMGPSVRDDLVRRVSDRLDVPVAYVTRAVERGGAPAARSAAAAPARPVSGSPALDSEREVLALCLASGTVGRRFLEQLAPATLSSETGRAARAHLLEHFDDPLAGLDDQPGLGAIVAAIVAEAQDMPPAHEPRLRVSALQLQKNAVERDLRAATEAGDRPRQAALAAERQELKRNIDEAMSQTV